MKNYNILYLNNINFYIFIFESLILCIIMLLMGYLLGDISNGYYKNIQFESGIYGIGNTKLRFKVKFYIIAICFIIFEIESIYLYLWSIVIKETGWKSFIEISIFIINILSSLIYLNHIGIFN